MFSARPSASCGASASNTFATPAIFAAASAAACALEPATSTWISPPIFEAAAIVFNVAALIDALSCSAITRIVTLETPSQDLGFGLQLLDQRLHVRHLHTSGARRRLADFQHLQACRAFHPQAFRLDRFPRLLPPLPAHLPLPTPAP